MGELEVAVKTIHRQYVNPQLTPQQALDVIGQVTSWICFDIHNETEKLCCLLSFCLISDSSVYLFNV